MMARKLRRSRSGELENLPAIHRDEQHATNTRTAWVVRPFRGSRGIPRNPPRRARDRPRGSSTVTLNPWSALLRIYSQTLWAHPRSLVLYVRTRLFTRSAVLGTKANTCSWRWCVNVPCPPTCIPRTSTCVRACSLRACAHCPYVPATVLP